MGIHVPAVGSPGLAEAPAVQTSRPERTSEPARAQLRAADAVVVDTLPSRPPSEVLEEIQRAG